MRTSLPNCSHVFNYCIGVFTVTCTYVVCMYSYHQEKLFLYQTGYSKPNIYRLEQYWCTSNMSTCIHVDIPSNKVYININATINVLLENLHSGITQTRTQTTQRLLKGLKWSTMLTPFLMMRPNVRSTISMDPWAFTLLTSLEKKVLNTISSCQNAGSRWEMFVSLHSL